MTIISALAAIKCIMRFTPTLKKDDDVNDYVSHGKKEERREREV
jgi:hypothetical protein